MNHASTLTASQAHAPLPGSGRLAELLALDLRELPARLIDALVSSFLRCFLIVLDKIADKEVGGVEAEKRNRD